MTTVPIFRIFFITWPIQRLIMAPLHAYSDFRSPIKVSSHYFYEIIDRQFDNIPFYDFHYYKIDKIEKRNLKNTNDCPNSPKSCEYTYFITRYIIYPKTKTFDYKFLLSLNLLVPNRLKGFERQLKS